MGIAADARSLAGGLFLVALLARKFLKVETPRMEKPVEPPPKIMPKYIHTETLTRRQMIAEMGDWKRFESMTDGEIRREYLKMIENEYVL